MSVKSITLQKNYLVTRQVIKSLKNPNVEVSHRFDNHFTVYLRDGYKYIASEDCFNFPSALETVRTLLLLGVPTKLEMTGSTTFKTNDLLEFLLVPKYVAKEETLSVGEK